MPALSGRSQPEGFSSAQQPWLVARCCAMRPRSPRQRRSSRGATRRPELGKLYVGKYQSSEFKEHGSGELVNVVVPRPARPCHRDRCCVARRSPHVAADGRGHRAGVRVVDGPGVLAEIVGAVRPQENRARSCDGVGGRWRLLRRHRHRARTQRRVRESAGTFREGISCPTCKRGFGFHPPCSRSSTTGATELVDLSQRSSGPTTPITTLPTATSM